MNNSRRNFVEYKNRTKKTKKRTSNLCYAFIVGGYKNQQNTKIRALIKLKYPIFFSLWDKKKEMETVGTKYDKKKIRNKIIVEK